MEEAVAERAARAVEAAFERELVKYALYIS
jgi:hypothetical protein